MLKMNNSNNNNSNNNTRARMLHCKNVVLGTGEVGRQGGVPFHIISNERTRENVLGSRWKGTKGWESDEN